MWFSGERIGCWCVPGTGRAKKIRAGYGHPPAEEKRSAAKA
jgi:hypothetical protein